MWNVVLYPDSFPVVIDVAMRREELAPADVGVVIDVLRASSTALQALGAGYRRVLFTDTLERARALRSADRILAGERNCVMPEGFDQGNSPQDAGRCRGSELVLATTNGAPTVIAAAGHAPLVLIGCLLNLEAVTDVVLARITGGATRVQLVCSGTDGAVALEDVYLAGRLSILLPGERTDAARVAEAVAAAYPDPSRALAHSRDAELLRRVGCEADIDFCAQESILALAPSVQSSGQGIATIVAEAEPSADREPPAEPARRVAA
jgi:2-phosphosulfolactate phosphatase